jgi:hypothetical protein
VFECKSSLGKAMSHLIHSIDWYDYKKIRIHHIFLRHRIHFQCKHSLGKAMSHLIRSIDWYDYKKIRIHHIFYDIASIFNASPV